ncbi:hypothetical protein CYMTET_20711, partial [Cymbomonas tetramitiformis]
VARYLETLKAYENKPADNIQERQDNDFMSRLTAALTTVRGVNRTDVHTLINNFGTMAGVMAASRDDLVMCPGMGPTKVKRLREVFHEPLKRSRAHTSTALALPPAHSLANNSKDTMQTRPSVSGPLDSYVVPRPSSAIAATKSAFEPSSDISSAEVELLQRPISPPVMARWVCACCGEENRHAGSECEVCLKDF